jgi:hypothetical protein
MMSNYNFSSGTNSSNHSSSSSRQGENTRENNCSLELTEKEMQDLADSISPVHSFDSLTGLQENDIQK